MEAKRGRMLQDLGEGLLLRWGTMEDAEQLAAFNVKVHSDDPADPELWLSDWTKDLMSGLHPTTKASDFTVVVDQRAGNKIVSSLCLISQTWTFDGIPFGVGRIELVGTDPEYRRRGLVRRQMAAVHHKSAQRGEMVQAITGNPWFYRQFGYEMAVNLEGGRSYFWKRSGNDAPQQEESFFLRPAEKRDLLPLQELYAEHCSDSLIVHQYDPEIWAYTIFTAAPKTPAAKRCYMVETKQGELAAYAQTYEHDADFVLREMGVRKGQSWRAIALFLISELKKQVADLNQTREKPITSINFALGESHPMYEALGSELEKPVTPYAWYIRVHRWEPFLYHIAPVLEQRLAKSVMAGHSGTLRLNFYSSGLRLLFKKGRLSEIGACEPKDHEDADAAFPFLTFIQLLLGYRSLAELEFAYADCYTNNAGAAVLVNCLFPRRQSDINPLS